MVYGCPAIVGAVDLQLTVQVSPSKIPGLHFPQEELLSEQDKALVHQTAVHLQQQISAKAQRRRTTKSGIHVEVLRSAIPLGQGMGSSAALCVALIRAFAQFYQVKLTQQEIFSLAWQAENAFHGTSSGIDPAASTFGGSIRFVKEPQNASPDIQTLHQKEAFSLILAHTGQRAETKKLVQAVKERKENNPTWWNKLFSQAQSTVQIAQQAIEQGNLKELGKQLNVNQKLLETIGVSTPELEQLIEAARQYGALGAKLTGAGGGGSMLCLVTPEKRTSVLHALEPFAAGVHEVEVH